MAFGGGPAIDMFQKKIGELFSSVLNIFGITDDSLSTGFSEQGKDHDNTLDKVPQHTGKLGSLTKYSVFSDVSAFPSFGK